MKICSGVALNTPFCCVGIGQVTLTVRFQSFRERNVFRKSRATVRLFLVFCWNLHSRTIKPLWFCSG